MSANGKNKPKEDCGCYAASRGAHACPPLRNITHPLRYYEFTQEELKALEECDRESFYRRCLPLSTTFAAVMYAAIRCGLVRRHAVWGAAPNMALAALLGHAAGRLLHQPFYDERLRRLPANSHLGNVMRQYHKENYPELYKKK